MYEEMEFENLPFEMEEEALSGEAEFMFEGGFGESEFELPVAGGAELIRVIPDTADYRRHIPIEYRLNAKKIVGEFADDLQKGRPTKLNISAGDIAKFVLGSSVAAPIKILIGVLRNIPEGYQAAAEKIAREESASGFSRGVLVGANGRTLSVLSSLFGNRYFPPNNFFPHGRKVSITNYRAGLLAGYAQGRSLSERQRVIFWRDLGHRMGDQSYRGPRASWSRQQLVSWYVDTAAAFRRYHLA